MQNNVIFYINVYKYYIVNNDVTEDDISVYKVG